MPGARLWTKMIAAGVLVSLGGPALIYYVTPTEEELFLRYNPELQKRSLENRIGKQEDFDHFVNKLKEYSKSSKPNAGVAVLLTEDKRLIEFPSILLPPDISSGSIVDVNTSRNFASEDRARASFERLQETIFTTFGQASPSPPVLRCRNATQTSLVLEWDPIQLATAELRSLSLYRNGQKAGNVPRDKLSTKISGLAVDTEYTFHLVLRTSAGTYPSEKLTVRTHKMTDLSGITITPGPMPAQLRDSLAETVHRIGAKLIDQVRIDTTHFVCTEGRGQAWEKAVEMNIPVVVPDWVKGCEREGRIAGVRGYYLNADPRLRQVGPGVAIQGQGGGPGQTQQQPPQPQQQHQQQQQQQQQQASQSQQRVVPVQESPRIEHTPPTPERPQQSPREGGTEKPPPLPPKYDSIPEEPSRPSSTATPEPRLQIDKDEKIRGAPRTDEDENGSSDEFEDGGPTEKEAEAQGNALKAVGIPYGSPEQPAS
ncbi:hypothetical protein LTR04_001861, partial [Oleoguttula sp. CCFEE 6159]